MRIIKILLIRNKKKRKIEFSDYLCNFIPTKYNMNNINRNNNNDNNNNDKSSNINVIDIENND